VQCGIGPHEWPIVAIPLRQPAVTWDPARESRAQVTARVTTHLRRELDRIHADEKLRRQLARRQANPHYARNQQIAAAARQGLSDRELGREYGLPPQRVREIIRIERYRMVRTQSGPRCGEDRHPARHGASGDRDVATAVPRARQMLRDP
jgi:hypothetical protein